MIYNGTLSVLNEVLWYPQFALPKVRPTYRAAEKETYMVEYEIGEIFLNFVLSKEVSPYYGVDIGNY